MTTLYIKARDDAFLSALLRVIEGQIRSAMADHKEWNLPESAARSIAKRLCGDVAANWSRLNAVRAIREPSAEASVEAVPAEHIVISG